MHPITRRNFVICNFKMSFRIAFKIICSNVVAKIDCKGQIFLPNEYCQT